jgi:hypothetical protein
VGAFVHEALGCGQANSAASAGDDCDLTFQFERMRHLHLQRHTARAQVIDELETLYEDIPDKKDRLARMEVIGSPHASFDDDDEALRRGGKLSLGRNNRGRQPKSRPGKPVGNPRAE